MYTSTLLIWEYVPHLFNKANSEQLYQTWRSKQPHTHEQGGCNYLFMPMVSLSLFAHE